MTGAQHLDRASSVGLDPHDADQCGGGDGTTLSGRHELCGSCGDPLFACPGAVRRFVRCCPNCTHRTSHAHTTRNPGRPPVPPPPPFPANAPHLAVLETDEDTGHAAIDTTRKPPEESS